MGYDFPLPSRRLGDKDEVSSCLMHAGMNSKDRAIWIRIVLSGPFLTF